MNGNGSGPLDILLDVFFGEVGPLFVTKWEDDGDVQGIGRFMLPQVDYMVAQPVGLETHIVRGEMAFLTSLGDKDLFPTRYIQMRQAVRKAEPQIFVHAMDGRMVGYMTRFSSSWDASSMLNGCMVSFQFERVNETDPFTDLTELKKDPFSQCKIAAAIADQGLYLINAPIPTDAGGGFLAMVEDLETLIDDVNTYVSDISSSMTSFRQVVEQVMANPQLQDAKNHDVYRAVREASSQALRAADEACQRAPRIIEVPALQAKMSPIEAAAWIYRDPGRVDDILALNPARYFFYPRGTILQVPDL